MKQQLFYFIGGIIIGILSITAFIYGQHGGWQDKYTSANGTRCCGPQDCQAVPVQDGVQVEVLVMRVRITIPMQSVHPFDDSMPLIPLSGNDDVGGLVVPVQVQWCVLSMFHLFRFN